MNFIEAIPLYPQVFKRGCEQYDRLRKRNAFLDQYRRHAIFADNLDMFNDAREMAQHIIEDYTNAENPDFISSHILSR